LEKNNGFDEVAFKVNVLSDDQLLELFQVAKNKELLLQKDQNFSQQLLELDDKEAILNTKLYHWPNL
jgi:hypothetical protein